MFRWKIAIYKVFGFSWNECKAAVPLTRGTKLLDRRKINLAFLHARESKNLLEVLECVESDILKSWSNEKGGNRGFLCWVFVIEMQTFLVFVAIERKRNEEGACIDGNRACYSTFMAHVWRIVVVQRQWYLCFNTFFSPVTIMREGSCGNCKYISVIDINRRTNIFFRRFCT